MRHRIKSMLFKLLGMLNCAKFEDLYCDRQDSSPFLLSAWRLRFHIGICRQCRSYLAAYERTIELEKLALSAQDEEAPAELPADLLEDILAQRRQAK